MTDLASQFLPMLGRTTLMLTLSALLCGLLLRPARPRSALPHRVGWMATLLVGWSFLRLTVPVVWYEAPPDAPTHQIGGMLPASMRKPATPATPPPGEATLEASSISWPAVAMLVWGLGMTGLMGTWSVGYLRFLRRLPKEQPVEAAWEAQWHALLAGVGAKKPIRLRVTADIGPLLCRRPGGYELMIPAELWRELNIDQRAAILRHELAHYLRGDVWKSLAARLLMLPHWFNPAAWWAVRRFDEAGEWACDQAVLEDGPASTYAQALLKLGQQAATANSPGLAARGGSLAVRIRRLLLLPLGNESQGKQAAIVSVICLTGILALLRLELVAKEPAVQDSQADELARLSEATAILDRLAESHDPATGKVARQASEDLRQRLLTRAPLVVVTDREPGDLPTAPRRGRKAPGTTPYQGPTYPRIPNYVQQPRLAGQTWTIHGPRGEMFETDGLHLWRIEGPFAAYATPEGYPSTQPAAPANPEYRIASPDRDYFVAPETGEVKVGETSTRDDANGSSENKRESDERLQHDGGKSAGKRSIAGSGHAVRFESTGDDRLLTSVRVFGSRYGLPQAPDEDFHVWLCDEKMQEIAQFDFPYATFERGDPSWVNLKTAPTKVPKKFIICVGFNPQQTKGVYVHFDGQAAKHSLTGLPGKEPKAFPTGNWMIRVTLSPAQSAPTD